MKNIWFAKTPNTYSGIHLLSNSHLNLFAGHIEQYFSSELSLQSLRPSQRSLGKTHHSLLSHRNRFWSRHVLFLHVPSKSGARNFGHTQRSFSMFDSDGQRHLWFPSCVITQIYKHLCGLLQALVPGSILYWMELETIFMSTMYAFVITFVVVELLLSEKKCVSHSLLTFNLRINSDTYLPEWQSLSYDVHHPNRWHCCEQQSQWNVIWRRSG